MASSSPPTPTFQKILNFRDVGATISHISSASHLRQGILYRSARPDNATEADRVKLVSEYGIRTVIDLRSKTEHINAAKKYSDVAALAQSAAIPSSNEAIAASLKIPGIQYVEVSLTGRSFERALMWQLSWSQMAHLVGLMALGYRNEGISILGKNVMQPKGLVGLGRDTLDYSGKEVKEIFDVLALEESYPVMIHCTQGKDRTGLVIILLLLLCGTDMASIGREYMQSEKELQPEMKERLAEIASIGLDSSFAGCPVDFVEKVVAHINERYSSIESYLQGIGIGIEQQNRIRSHLEINR